MGREYIVDQSRTNIRNLVGGDGCTDTATAEGYAAINITGRDSPRQRYNEVRIVVIQIQSVCAEIHNFVARCPQ